nr:DUF4062 domain-containing protein [Herbaspirillum aquaticum]
MGESIVDKKYQIFVSSTYEDLKAERDQVIKAVLEMGHIPVGMEMFSAADEHQWKIIERQISESDYYVVIAAHRYGSVDESGISYTEKEYDFAVSSGVPVLGFVIEDAAAWPATMREKTAEGAARLDQFKIKIKGRYIQFWRAKDDLYAKVSISLMKTINSTPRVGWVRGSQAAGPQVASELSRLSQENSQLREALAAAKRKAEPEEELESVMDTLIKNKRTISVRKTSAWSEAESFETNLADIFEYIAPYVLTENSIEGIAKNIALGLSGTGYHANFPVPRNVTTDLVADFVALGVLVPSTKKHSVSDTSAYYTLSPLGLKINHHIRRFGLQHGQPSTRPASNVAEVSGPEKSAKRKPALRKKRSAGVDPS